MFLYKCEYYIIANKNGKQEHFSTLLWLQYVSQKQSSTEQCLCQNSDIWGAVVNNCSTLIQDISRILKLFNTCVIQ